MKTKMIMHIGAAKTGSSAVQSFLRRNVGVLEKYGYLVPDRYLGLTPSITGEHVWAFQEYISSNNFSGLTARLDQLMTLAGEGKTILTSAENLSNLGNHQFLAAFCKDRNVKVILYIRRQDDLLTSAWQQWHCKVQADFDAWLIRGLKRYGHWNRIADDWESVVGLGKIGLRVFERDAMFDRNLLRDFVDAIGLTEHINEFDYDVGIVNPSFSDIITPLIAGNKRLFNDANDNEFSNFLLNTSPPVLDGGKKISLLSPELRNSIIAHYADCNSYVAAKYFSRRQALFSPVDHNKYIYLTGNSLRDEQMRYLIELIYLSFKNLKPK